MAEIILCYAREDAAAARRLAAAVAAQGYGLWSEQDLAGDGEGGDVTERISGAGAAIVLWSAAAAASEWVRAEANFARGQRKLIQASIDESPPPLPFRPADIVSIAGWQGEESHPGWRRIRARLEQLCGPPRAAGGAIAPAAAAAAAAAPTPAAAPPRRRSRGGLVAGLTLALLAAVALATFVWMRDLAPSAPQRPPAPAAASAPAAPRPSPAAPPAASIVDPVAPEPPPPVEQADLAAEPPARPRPAGPRIIRENSENMRLFCERAGRGTPECRTFARRLRSQRR